MYNWDYFWVFKAIYKLILTGIYCYNIRLIVIWYKLIFADIILKQ